MEGSSRGAEKAYKVTLNTRMFILDGKQLVKISLILSVSSFYIVLGEANNGLKMDNAITVLSILVTILIGWNIYTIIDIKGIRKEFEELKKSCVNDIAELKKMQSIIDVRGGNKDKCAIIDCHPKNSQGFDISSVNTEIEKFYESLGLDVSLVTMQFNSKDNHIFFNGGLNDVYTEYLKTMLTSKFDLDSIDISYKSIEEIGAMFGILVK